ncbi:MAG: tetratricopeptide repeat protein [Tepidisphaeraceae bacterium]|jgi:predicted O-linked N-acetylglucosamine transferase (SPINDLY family)
MSAQMTLQQQLKSGLSHQQAGRLAEAERIYRQVLAQQPNHADALHLLGILAAQAGRLDAAVESIRRAIEICSTNAFYYGNLGSALAGMGRLEEAIAAYRQSIRLKPDLTEAHNNLGNALKDTGQFDEAIASLRQAIRLKGDLAEAHNNLGNALTGMGRLDEAIAAYRQAIRLKPDYAEAHSNLGHALCGKGQLDEGIAACRQAVRLGPDLAVAHNNLGNAIKNQGQLEEAIGSYRQAIGLKPDFATAHSNLVFTLQYHAGYDAKMIHEELRRWNRRHAEPLAKLIQSHQNNRDPLRRLRIGYVSADFYDHASAFFLLPLFRHHDRRQFELFCYALNANSDKVTQQMKDHVQHWRRAVGLTDAKVAAQVREDQIDILVDLKLHTGGNRLLIFAQKPAPVQVTWLGYPGTTGLNSIDYRLTDPYLDPPGLDDAYYSERSIHLPDTFWCYDPLTNEPAVNAPPCLEQGFVTFGCLNNFCKVTDAVLTLWAGVLKAISNSRLLLLAPEGSSRQSVLDRLGREGIGPERVEFVAKRSRSEYLNTYHHIDIGLDTVPYNGHTTSLDSFWMGVPVITLAGQTVVGRAGLSQLTNLGLPELIARRPQQYVQIAMELAGDLPRLAELRRTLRGRMQSSPLMDAPRFARNVEAAYRQMWRKWCEHSASPTA